VSPRPPPTDASDLLNEVMRHPLDASYAEAAARRAALDGASTEGRRARLTRTGLVWLAAGVAVVMGVGTGLAIAALRAPAPEFAAAQARLAAEATERQQAVQALTEQGSQLSAQVDALEAEALGLRAPQAARAARALSIASGAAAVTGPGLAVVLDEDATAIADGQVGARLRAGDLQVVINGLWQAGAEAIAVNDIRLTSLSPVSNAGEAVLVSLVPVSPPYTVAAIGDGEVLQIKLARTDAWPRLSVLRSQFGAFVQVEVRDALTLPAAGGISTLHYAQPPDLSTQDSPNPRGGDK